jgi:hypothetical protein
MAGVGTINGNIASNVGSNGRGYGMETDDTVATGGGQTAATPAATTATATTPTANPLQPSYLATPPTAVATTYQNPYDPSTATSELNQAAGVQDNQQQQALMSMLAAQGISPGSSAAQAAMQNLSATQNAALDPTLASAQQYGAGLSEQSGLANAGAANTMTSQNLQDLLQSQEFNASAYNTAGLTSAGYGNEDWLAQLQAQLGLQDQGLATSGSLAGDQANQTVPLNPSLFSQITGAASAASPFFQAGNSASPSSPSYYGENGENYDASQVAADNAAGLPTP